MQLLSPGRLTSLVLCVLLGACGGGGGGGNRTEPETPVDPNPPMPPVADSFTVAGTVTASQSQAVDSDTNDPNRGAIANNDIASAQPIGNPITLGGYVNLPGQGATGSSRQLGDIDDYFIVNALAGQTITMLVADFETADADLYLYNTQGDIIDFSIETGDVESLVIPSDGTYIINAFAFSGATNYILGIAAPAAASLSNSQQHPIAPYQAIVRYKEEAQSSGATSSTAQLAQSMGLTQRGGGPGRPHLLELQPRQAGTQAMNDRLGNASSKLADISDADLRARFETLQTIKSLQRDPGIRSAYPNYILKTMAAPNDDGYARQWHYPMIGLPDAWEITTGSADVIVAVVDSGILGNHPDFAGQLVPGYDFVSDIENANDGDGYDPDPEDTSGFMGGFSSSYHGTHVSGTVAARGNNEIGVAGAAYSSRLMPVRSLGVDGSGLIYDIDQGIRFAAGLPNDSDTVPARRADVINLSLGGGPFIQDIQDTFNQVRAAGVTVVAAAGNEATAALAYPASYNHVISVSALDIQRRLTTYSNKGIAIDVAAPGGDSGVDLNGDGFGDGVFSTGGTSTNSGVNLTYTFLSGTSMASPHVAGVIALMKSVNSDLTPADIDTMLIRGDLTDDLGLEGRDDLFGHGIINARSAVVAALEAAGTTPADNPHLVSSLNSLSYGNSITSLEVVLRNGGKGGLELQTLTSSDPWLQINELDVDAAGLGTYEVIVNRDGLAAGIFAGNINVQSSVNNLAIRVFMSVGEIGEATDVGVVYVLLVEPGSDEPLQQYVSDGHGAEYPYQFEQVPSGVYEIVAGSDADNDLLICDAGEACGAWLTTDQPIEVTVDKNTFDLDFPVDYQISIPNLGVKSLSGTARIKNQSPDAPLRSLAD